jgi:lysine 2,3-aminomutase
MTDTDGDARHQFVHRGSTSPAARQPFRYSRRALREPDWRRLPGFVTATPDQWRDAHWQRRNSITSVEALVRVFGAFLPESLARSIAADSLATMAMRVTPQMLNTMNEHDLWADPLRRYLLPAADDREPVWHTHPHARRDSLREEEMSIVPAMVQRYPTKVLIELTTTCPVYCGHCTRMDLVGPDVGAVTKRRQPLALRDQIGLHLATLEALPSVRDVVLSGGDIANVPPQLLQAILDGVLQIEHVRSIRLATKTLGALPQFFLQDSTLRVLERSAARAAQAGVDLAVHTHINHVQTVTPLVVEAAQRLRSVGICTIRNQGVLLRRVNATVDDILDLCFVLLDEARIYPYYFYLCDLVPHAEHWRVTLAEAQRLQEQIAGYLPGFGTPRFVCDVPGLGKCAVHQASSYDRMSGISTWRKHYWTPLDRRDADPSEAEYQYFDPIALLPPEGRSEWSRRVTSG